MKALIRKLLDVFGLGMKLDVYLLTKRSKEGELGKSFDRMRNFYSELLDKDSLVFDVGANLGNYAQIYIDLGCKVIAVEPQQYCMNFMRARFGSHHPQISFVHKGLDKEPGTASLHISDAHTLSSMSDNWIKAVKDSGRFSDKNWSDTVEVEVTTLDHLIKEYGRPTYCKIDVEGFEYNVLSGLNSPVNYISLEFTYECFDAALKCMDHISSLGNFQFNFVKGDYEGFELEKWLLKDDFHSFLKDYAKEGSMGDIFAKEVK